MAHYAKVRDGVVVETIVATAETLRGMVDNSPGHWIQTSYNTKGGVHYDPVTGQPSADQSKALRGNYAGIGMIYDVEYDVFYAKQPFPSWTLNQTTWTWEPPTPKPAFNEETGYDWDWNEGTQSWETYSGPQTAPFDPVANPPVIPAPPELPPLTQV